MDRRSSLHQLDEPEPLFFQWHELQVMRCLRDEVVQEESSIRKLELQWLVPRSGDSFPVGPTCPVEVGRDGPLSHRD